jgi:hypothetical protein
VDFSVIQAICDELSGCFGRMVADLAGVCPPHYTDLGEFFKKTDDYLKFILTPKVVDVSPPFVLSLDDTQADSRELVGGKAHNLAAIKRDLQLLVPNRFLP